MNLDGIPSFDVHHSKRKEKEYVILFTHLSEIMDKRNETRCEDHVIEENSTGILLTQCHRTSNRKTI
jgi:hypothetical protein